MRPQQASRRTRQSSLSDPAADPRRLARNAPISDTDTLPPYPGPRTQQEAPLTRIPSIGGGTRTSSDSQRSTRRGLSSEITSAVEVDPASRDRTSSKVGRSEKPLTDTQSRHQSSRDQPRHSTARRDESTEKESGGQRLTLSNLLTKFVAFGDDQYDNIASFCEYHPAIWDEDLKGVQSLIANYLRRGDTDQARRLAQRLLMLTLTWRKSSTPADQQRWLNRLGRSTQLQDELDEKVDVLLASLERASAKPAKR